MPPRKNRDKEVQPAQAEHADDSPLHSEGENDPITFLPVSPLAERSYGNPVFKEKEADRGGDFAESSNMFRGMTECLDLAFKEQNQVMRRLVDSQTESSRRQEELVRQCIEEMRRIFEEGTRVMRETGEESRRTLQAVSEQVVEQVRQPRPEIPPPVVEMPRQIQEAPIPVLGGQGNQPHPNIPQQNFFMGEGQRQHEPMEAAAPVADHGHQPQHRYVPLGRRGNVGPHHQPYPRDFFQPQVPPAQPVQRGLQNHPAQLFNRDQLIDLVQETYGPALRPLVRPAYRKPYPDIIDHENPFPRGFKVPEFTLFSGEAASHGTYYSDPNFDLDVAEVVTDKPVVCPDLVRPTHQPETSVRRYVGEAGKQYTFDVSKASDIFDHLKKSGLIKLPPGHKIPTAAEIGTRDYCKFHNSWKHSIDNCLIFRNVLQEKIDKGFLKFPDKAKETMGVDADPFPAVSVGVNVADLRSVARNRSLPYAQRNLAAEDLRWVLEAQRSRHSRSVSEFVMSGADITLGFPSQERGGTNRLFGLPETVTTDQGTVFVSHQVEALAKEMGFCLLNSTPYYAQANGQAEASNKVVINLLEKMVDDNPRRWHELLSETLWAYRTSQRSSTKITPFALTYGHDAVLPMELTARSLRVMIQHNLQSGEYDEAMMLELEDLEDSRLTALDRLQAQKLKVAKSYNKRVKGKNLVVGDLVWKAILPLGKKNHRFGKWSPNWEGPFRIHEVLRGGAYWLESLDRELHPKKINGIYLKPYYPTVWEARGLESQEAV
ncbi:hypothetical protein SLEP1_g15243 [Rubroshorea leprosula]|uniref:Integrase catalytic domain-containing protein n=1 Tax=Rubroshorea leprosula TaxID=152421 RepID=A0AAV5IXH3_9ROSI|nr:hypothetical protein SLEP1_g15243 [Rubroshorea leprosula]